jgi:hypothetical protein
VLLAAAGLPLAGCSAVDSLLGSTSTTTTSSQTLTETPTTGSPGTGSDSASPAPDLSLPPLNGYTYTDPPQAVSDQLGTVGKQFDGVFTATAAKGVTAGGKPVAAVVRYGVDSGVTGTKEFETKLLDSMLAGLAGQGAATKREVIGDQPVVSAFPKQGTGIVAWYRENVITIVLGADPGQARAYSMAYLAKA